MRSLFYSLKHSIVDLVTSSNSAVQILNIPIGQASFDPSCLDRTYHQCFMLTLTNTVLEAICLLLVQIRLRFCQNAMELLGNCEELMDVICAGIVLKEGSDPGCKIKGVQVLKELAMIAADSALWRDIKKVRIKMPISRLHFIFLWMENYRVFTDKEDHVIEGHKSSYPRCICLEPFHGSNDSVHLYLKRKGTYKRGIHTEAPDEGTYYVC